MLQINAPALAEHFILACLLIRTIFYVKNHHATSVAIF